MADKCMELTFNKRVCSRYCASSNEDGRCACGQSWHYHTTQADGSMERAAPAIEIWNPTTHTATVPTDAFGTIDFHDGAHPNKAQYIRLAHDSPSDRILQLLTRGWGLELPKLVISVHGGKANFDLSPRLKKVIQTGLLRAAKTTGAWLLTGGTNSGVTRHVGDALISERSPRLRSGRVVSIGIAPWGVIENRHLLVGQKKDVTYVSIDQPRSKLAVLNNRHAYFLLVDNGTVGHSGAEIALRRKLEKYISSQLLPVRTQCSIPVVCVIIEGGIHTIRTVLEFVTDSPPVPVVVCEGSGRAADLIAYACKYMPSDEESSEASSVKSRLLSVIQKMFKTDVLQAKMVLSELMVCVEKKNLVTIFSAVSAVLSEESDEEHSLDQAILTSTFTSRHLSSPKQLSLAIAWDRVDIARSEIFVYGQEWPEGALEEAMMDALDKNRVDFVHLLLDKGVQMANFLTVPRLEELYNSKQGPTNTLRYIVHDVRPHITKNYAYTLSDVGLVINKLMGGAYRSFYTKRTFRQCNDLLKKHSSTVELSARSLLEESGRNGQVQRNEEANTSTDTALTYGNCGNIFKEPFNHLLTWAVLTKRQAMAHLMWQHGEQALAKALIACNLYRAMANEAAGDDLDIEISDELRRYAKEFESAALELLDFCYRRDDELTRQLLTCELVYWNRQNCLRLAQACNHRAFLAHPCSQVILSDLWMGGLRSRRWTNIKVFLCLFLPPMVLQLDFKSVEELQLMPQTMEEHLLERKEENARYCEDASSCASEALGGSTSNSAINAVYIEDIASSKEEAVFQTSIAYKSRRKQRQLKVKKKFYEFYTAPISKFWCHSVAYMAFLLIYTYTLLIRLPSDPEWNEYYVIAFIVTFGCEKVREILASEPIQMRQKLWVWLHSKWNVCDAIFVLEFLLGLVLRLSAGLIDHGRVLYCLNIVYWYMRIPRIFMVSKFLGPFVVIIGKMVYSMMRFIALMVVNIMAYGVFRQTLLYPDEGWSWSLVRNVFYQPFFMIFGEEFVNEINPPCGPDEDVKECVAGRWLNPLVMSIYLLLTYILLVNLLIAVFNSIFAKANAISRQIWKSSRFAVIMEYEQKPILPCPLIFISHCVLLIKWCRRRAEGREEIYDQGLTLFLSEADLERLYDFEEECMEGLAKEKENKQLSSAEERTRLMGERLEGIGSKVTECWKLFGLQNRNLETVGYRIMKMEGVAKKIRAELKNLGQSIDPVAMNAVVALHDPVQEQQNVDVTCAEEFDEAQNFADKEVDGDGNIASAQAISSIQQLATNVDDVDPTTVQRLQKPLEDAVNINQTEQSLGTKASVHKSSLNNDEARGSDQSSSNELDCAVLEMCRAEYSDVFDEPDEENTVDSPPALAIARAPLTRRSFNVESKPKLRRRIRNYSETSSSPPRIRRSSVQRRKSLQVLASRERFPDEDRFIFSGRIASLSSASSSVNYRATSADFVNFTVPQLPLKPIRKEPVQKLMIPLAKIEAEAEHLREMEGHDYRLLEGVIRRRMCRDSEDLGLSLEETEDLQSNNVGLTSIREAAESIDTECDSTLPLREASGSDRPEAEEMHQLGNSVNCDKIPDSISLEESVQIAFAVVGHASSRPQNDVKIDVDDDPIEYFN